MKKEHRKKAYLKKCYVLTVCMLLISSLLTGCKEEQGAPDRQDKAYVRSEADQQEKSTPLSIEEFTSIMEQHDFQVEAQLLAEDNPNRELLTPYEANNGVYWIAYYRVRDTESAYALFDLMAGALLESPEGAAGNVDHAAGDNANYFALDSDEYYCIINQTENIIIYTCVDPAYTEEVKDIFDDLGLSGERVT